ncbi:hypothetical protein LSAT2_006418 [Lamellibrachia satsuma]|nr:hypothetical protein LSAT2_006418 [Lamellibrachia satsuma]
MKHQYGQHSTTNLPSITIATNTRWETLLQTEVLGADAKYTVYDDFKPVGEVQTSSYYAHVIEKSASTSQYLLTGNQP